MKWRAECGSRTSSLTPLLQTISTMGNSSGNMMQLHWVDGLFWDYSEHIQPSHILEFIWITQNNDSLLIVKRHTYIACMPPSMRTCNRTIPKPTEHSQGSVMFGPGTDLPNVSAPFMMRNQSEGGWTGRWRWAHSKTWSCTLNAQQETPRAQT